MLDVVQAIGVMSLVIVLPPFFGIQLMYTSCWLTYACLAYCHGSEKALGLATTMGLTIMTGWYTLQALDRAAWPALLNGWLGIWSKVAIVPQLARIIDIFVHIFVPLVMYCNFSSFVRPWMGIAALLFARLWSVVSVRKLDFFAPSDDIYRFNPPRSKHFWDAAYKLQIILDLIMPFLCIYIQERPLDLYKYMLICCSVVLMIQTIRSLLLPQLRQRAKAIMTWLLNQGTISVGRDLVVHNDSMWLDWMTSGMLAIGESYITRQWDTGKASSSVDQIVAALLSLPAAARRQIFHSWEARVVSLLARLLQYPSSCCGSLVGRIHEQADVGPELFAEYMDPSLHASFGIWDTETTSLDEAQKNKFKLIASKLGLEDGAYVLDLSAQSHGGWACYIAKEYSVPVLCVVTSHEERLYSQAVAEKNNVSNLVTFLTLEEHFEFSSYFSKDEWENKFSHVYSVGWIEQLHPEEVPACLQVLFQISKPRRHLLLEFIGSTGSSIVSSQIWANTYIHKPNHPTTLPSCAQVCDAARSIRFQIVRADAYSNQADRTFVAWYNNFTQRFSSQPSELPDSFRRTWEFYLLHSAACLRVRAIQSYLVELA